MIQKIFQIVGLDGQKGTALVDNTQFAKQHALIISFLAYYLADNIVQLPFPGFDQFPPSILDQPGGIDQFHQVEAAEISQAPLCGKVLHESLDIFPQPLLR